MATWKKVVVSGSAISALNNDANYLVDGQAGAALTGSFTGSFKGDGSGLTGVVASNTNALTNGVGIQSFSYDGSVNGVTVDVDVTALDGNGLSTSGNELVVQAADTTIAVGATGINVVEANLSGIPNSALTNDSVTLGTTEVDLGTTATTLAGLTLTGVVATGSFSGSFKGEVDINLADLTAGAGLNGTAYDGNDARIFSVDSGSLAGTGLGADGTGLIVNVDTTTIEINTDTLRVKDGGIGTNQIADSLGTLGSNQFTGSFSGSFVGDSSGLTGTGGSIISGDAADNQVAVFNSSNTIDGYANFTFNDSTNTLTVTGDELITGNLTVQGTASFQHETNLDVADRFIRLASGSSANGDGGIVIQQNLDGTGEVFGFDNPTKRFGVSGSFDAATNTFTPDAFMAAVVEGTANDPTAVIAKYTKKGNIFVANNGDIHIYS